MADADYLWLRETVAEMRTLGVIKYAGVELGPAPRAASDEEAEEPKRISAAEMRARKLATFYKAAK